MQDQRGTQELLGQQALAVQTAFLGLADQMVLLALVGQTAWLDLWVLPALKANADLRARQARTDRLVRRGIPASLARQGLRVL